MKISDIGKYKWRRHVDRSYKWHENEIALKALGEDLFGLYKIFTTVGVSTLVLKKQWFYEEEASFIWERDRTQALKDKVSFLTKIVIGCSKYLKQAETVVYEAEGVNKLDPILLDKIKKAQLILWSIFCCDLGEVAASLVDVDDLVDEPQVFVEEEKALQEIIGIKSKIKRQQKLMDHWQKYQWLNYVDIDSKPYSLSYFQKRLRVLKPIKKRKKNYPKKGIKLLSLINRHIFIDNFASDLYIKLDFLVWKLLSKVTDIKPEELTWYSYSEIKDLVRSGKKISKEDLKIRKAYRAIVQINGEIKVFYGKTSFKKIESLVKVKPLLSAAKQFSGIIANKGLAKGAVKIVKGFLDIEKVQKGDIIVAVTTRPDLIAAIHRCAAIITDSGGITSHAAIVSREFNIPCIVGTKIATQVLKDGDLVEVDANKGIVKILS